MDDSDALRFTRSDDALVRVLDGEAVLLDMASGRYFALNEVGTRIWELLGEGLALGPLRARLLEEYDVDEATLARDVDDLCAELERRGLVRRAESPEPAE